MQAEDSENDNPVWERQFMQFLGWTTEHGRWPQQSKDAEESEQKFAKWYIKQRLQREKCEQCISNGQALRMEILETEFSVEEKSTWSDKQTAFNAWVTKHGR